MATKPDVVLDLPPAWATAGNYAAGVYGATLPWGDPSPLAGLPLPWGTQPRLNTTNLTSFAADGFTPQIPNDASVYNEWLRRMQVWQPWVAAGSDTPDADTHIVETDASGFVKKQGFFSTIGFVDASGNAAPLPQGAAVATGKTLSLVGTANISGGVGSAVDVETVLVTILEFDDAGTSLPDTDGEVRWNETTLTQRGPDSVVRSFGPASRGRQAAFSTPNAIDNTGAGTTRTIQETELVDILVVFDYEHTTGILGTLNTAINITGVPGNLDVDAIAHLLPASAGVRWRSKSIAFSWTPTDSFVGPGTDAYAFTFRVGSNLAATLNVRNIRITVESAIQV